MLALCRGYGLVITDTVFKHKKHHSQLDSSLVQALAPIELCDYYFMVEYKKYMDLAMYNPAYSSK